jgi:hypothetical protein
MGYRLNTYKASAPNRLEQGYGGLFPRPRPEQTSTLCQCNMNSQTEIFGLSLLITATDNSLCH